MKRSEFIFTSILVPIDILAIISAFVLGYFTRITTDQVIYVWNFSDYFRFVLVMVVFWVIIFALGGLYRKNILRLGALDLFARVFLASSSGVMLVVGYLFLSRIEFFSRLVIIYTWIYAIIFILLARLIVKIIYQELLRHGVGVHRVLVIGTGLTNHDIIAALNSNRYFGLKVVKIMDGFDFDKFEIIARETPFDEIILTDPSLDQKDVSHLADYCQINNRVLRLIPNLFQVKSANIAIETIDGIPILEFRKTPLEGWGAVIKRFMDIILSIILLIILSPVFLIIAIIIKLTSPGPILFRQTRVSVNKTFQFLKFRSMKEGAQKDHEKMIEEFGNMFKLKKDPRVTKFGRFLRITSLDELPQLWNVLMGNMSLVGPRPAMVEETKLYKTYQKKRLGIKPGITGLWQVSGRSQLDLDECVRLDVYYIENWSLWLDIKIMLKTIYVVFKRDGAY